MSDWKLQEILQVIWKFGALNLIPCHHVSYFKKSCHTCWLPGVWDISKILSLRQTVPTIYNRSTQPLRNVLQKKHIVWDVWGIPVWDTFQHIMLSVSRNLSMMVEPALHNQPTMLIETIYHWTPLLDSQNLFNWNFKSNLAFINSTKFHQPEVFGTAHRYDELPEILHLPIFLWKVQSYQLYGLRHARTWGISRPGEVAALGTSMGHGLWILNGIFCGEKNPVTRAVS
jgi:hypothetical protein